MYIKLKQMMVVLLVAVLILGCFPVSAFAVGKAVASLTPEMAEAYAKVLKSLQAKYGVYSGYAAYYTGPDLHDTGSGVAYAELIDFEGDGRDELLVSSVSSDCYFSIWTCAEGQSSAVCLYDGDGISEFPPYEGLRNCYLFRSGGNTYLYGFQNVTHHTIWNHNAALYAVSTSGLSAVDKISESFFFDARPPETNPEGPWSTDEMLSFYLYRCAINDVEVVDSDIDGNTMEWGSPEPGSREARDFYAKYPTNAMTQLRFWEAHDEEAVEYEDGQAYYYATSVVRQSWAHNDVSGLIASLELKALEGGNATSVLAAIPYFGERTNCRMSAETALAFADVIRQNAEPNTRVLLADVSGDGIPILIMWTTDTADWGRCLKLYQYINGRVTLFDGLDENAVAVCVRRAPAGTFLVLPADTANRSAETLCRIRNGEISVVCVLSAEPDEQPAYHVNGKTVDPEYYASLTEYYTGSGEDIQLRAADGSANPSGEPENIAWLLSVYAGKAGPFLQKNTASVGSECPEAAVRLAEETLGGAACGILRLSNELYYIAVTVDGREKGTLMKGTKVGGKVRWDIIETFETPASEEVLDAVLDGIHSRPNIHVDYSRAFGTVTDVTAALEDMLDNMDGLAPNDAAKQELARFIETAVSCAGTTTVIGGDSQISVSSETISSAAANAFLAEEACQSVLEERNASVNRALKVVISLVWINAEIGEPCRIAFDASALDALKGAALQIFLGDQQHYLELSSACIKVLLAKYDNFSIQMRREGSIYLIDFLDAAGNTIEKIPDTVTVALPCESQTETVMVQYSNGIDTWGGQFDPILKVISFVTPFPGRYEVTENALTISDISDLDGEVQDAIEFMVSKGFLTLENGMFRPDMMLNRYDFCQSIVAMFFSLDRGQRTDFPDVPDSSSYYSYVASGQRVGIIKGYDDGTFRGNALICMQEMLSLTARTLIEQKGYYEPADNDLYLNLFTDGTDTSEWAKTQVALAIREGLVNGFPALNPTAPVTRADAAVVLYRLFLLLNDVSPISRDFSSVEVLPSESRTGADEQMTQVAAVVLSGIGTICGLGGAAVCICLLRKKRGHR